MRDNIMLPLRLALCVLAPLFSASAEPANSNFFTGTSIPLPPQQSAPFFPPKSTLPEEVISAFNELFKQGLADPRGCEYREIEVMAGSCWGPFGIVKTRGWVLPETGAVSFAVAWNGLVYPVVRVGAIVALRKDVADMLAFDLAAITKKQDELQEQEDRREAQDKLQGKSYRRHQWPVRYYNAISEGQSLSATSNDTLWFAQEISPLRPLRAALLYRLGEVDLAEKVLAQWSGVKLQSRETSTYHALAREWMWSFYDRSVCAHMRGDHLLVQSNLNQLLSAQKLVDEYAARIPTNRHDPGPNFTYFLTDLPALAEDTRRRWSEAGYVPILQMAKPPLGQKRAIGLIRDLELVTARQEGQPGGVNLAGDSIVAALVACGDDAVEPLLDCLENDRRLTQSVRFHRDVKYERTILGVHEAAYVALANILQTRFFASNSMGDSLTAHGEEGRKEVAAAMRAYWLKYKGLSLEERWLQMLADDHAPPGQWIQAAGNIVQPSDVTISRSSMVGEWRDIPSREPGVKPALNGESLRKNRNPSVTELLLKRIRGLDFSGENNQQNVGTKISLCRALAKWDGPSALPEQQKLSSDLKERLRQAADNFESKVEDVLRVYQCRLLASDPTALADYADWLLQLDAEKLKSPSLDTLEILWQNPTDPAVMTAVMTAAEKLFAVPESPRAKNLLSKRDPEKSPLVGLKAFRVLLLERLKNRQEMGTVTVTEQSINALYPGGSRSQSNSKPPDQFTPLPGKSVAFRFCDMTASKVSELEGAPQFELFWPEAKKDETIPAIAAFLERYGDAFQYQPGEEIHLQKANIHFPHLETTATPEDVKNLKAIFSLEGEKRTVPIQGLPLEASWVTNQDLPLKSLSYGPDGKAVPMISYNNSGHIWQAEEVLVDGKWKRFYGFTGCNRITRVPAEEIEFKWNSTAPMRNGFVLSGNAPSQIRLGEKYRKLTLDDPMPLTLTLRNLSGLDQEIPADFLAAKGDEGKLPPAFELTLFYSPDTTERAWRPGNQWKALQINSVAARTEAFSGSSPVMKPNEEFAFASLNLRDYFEISQPGTYRIVLNKFTDGTNKVVGGFTQHFTVYAE